MRESDAVRQAVLEFYTRLSAGDVAAFEDVVSNDGSFVVIGTAPGEIVRDRDTLRRGFEQAGARIDAGTITGYEEGSVAWAVDEPTFHFAGGTSVRVRLTAVLHWEAGRWKVVHMHVSVGVPDDEVVELQNRWSGR